MTEQLHADQLTPISPGALYTALQDVWSAVVGGSPTRAALLVLLAQVAEETGWRSCHAWNLGNVKHVPGDGHDYVQFRCNEIINGKEVWFDPPHPATSFRWFATLEDGCVDYLGILHKHFAPAWPAVLAGDPTAFVHALKVAGYFTADEALYRASVVALDAQLAREIPDEPPLADVARDALLCAIAGRDIVVGPLDPSDLPPAVG